MKTAKKAPPAPALPEAVEVLEKARSLKLDAIKASKDNPRKTFNQEKLQGMADSIKLQGVLQPILVRQMWGEGCFELIDGERRYRAAKLAGLAEIPCCIVKMTDGQAAHARLIANDQREDISPLERAAAYQQRLDAGNSIEDLAQAVSKSVSAVREALLLGRCPPDLAAAVVAGKVPGSTAALVCRVPNDTLRKKVALHVLSGQAWWQGKPHVDRDSHPLSYRDTKNLIQHNCMVELKGATFDPLDQNLVKGAGTCTDCPKRLGNLQKSDPEGFPGGRGDVCMDPECYKRKGDAAAARKVQEAKDSGRKVLSATEAGKIFTGYDGATIDDQSIYLDLDRPKDRYTSDSRTYRQVLAEELKNGLAEKVVIAIDKTGRSHDLLAKKEARADLARHGVKVSIPSPRSGSGFSPRRQTDADWKKAQAKREAEIKLQQKIRSTIRIRQFHAFAAGAEALWITKQLSFLRFVANTAASKADNEQLLAAVGITPQPARDQKAKRKNLRAAIDKAPLANLVKLIGCGLVDWCQDVDEPELLAEFEGLCNVSLEEIEKAVRLELDPPLKLDGGKANGKGKGLLDAEATISSGKLATVGAAS